MSAFSFNMIPTQVTSLSQWLAQYTLTRDLVLMLSGESTTGSTLKTR